MPPVPVAAVAPLVLAGVAGAMPNPIPPGVMMPPAHLLQQGPHQGPPQGIPQVLAHGQAPVAVALIAVGAGQHGGHGGADLPLSHPFELRIGGHIYDFYVSPRIMETSAEHENHNVGVTLISNGPSIERQRAVILQLRGASGQAVLDNLTQADRDAMASLAREHRRSSYDIHPTLADDEIINSFNIATSDQEDMHTVQMPVFKKQRKQ